MLFVSKLLIKLVFIYIMVYITEKNKDILENITKRFSKSHIFFPLFSRRLLF